MKANIWILGWLILVLIGLCAIGGWVYKIDPYFHYHKPDTETYFYVLDNERSQNAGISKHFDYDALITGTSMTENFKTSEMDEIFGCTSIKVPYSGGFYKEINDNLIIALKNNPNLKTIVRCLDMSYFFLDKDAVSEHLGIYPTYLYDSNPFNDVMYLFNKDVIFGRAYQMKLNSDIEDFIPGITSFDDYRRWQYNYTYGINTVIPNGFSATVPGEAIHLTDGEKETIRDNITQNVTSLADRYPDVDFYYFFSPYSIVWWNDLVTNGMIYRQIEAEQYIIELILEHDNIHLYSFNNRTDIITDLNNYKDFIHYGQWVNSLVLKWMYEGEYLLTWENYLDYLEKERSFYVAFDYQSINGQEDYENDFFAAALLNIELAGVGPIDLLESDKVNFELANASIIDEQHDGNKGIQCIGSIHRQNGKGESVADYILNTEYVGAKMHIDDLENSDFLVFYGKKVQDHGQPTVFVLDDQKNIIAELMVGYWDIDNEWQRYMIDLSKIEGGVTIILNGGYVDSTGSQNSTYIFSDIKLY